MKIKKANKESSKSFVWGKNCDGWHLVGLPFISVIEERMSPNSSEIRHFHKKVWQFIYIISGTLELTIEDDVYVLDAREGLELPPGIEHEFHNKSNADIWYLLLSSPNDPTDRINTGA